MLLHNTDRNAGIASYVLAAGALYFVLHVGLLGALFSGLLVFSLVHMLAPPLERHISGKRAKLVAVAGLSALVIGALSLAIWGTILYLQSDAGNLQNLLQKMADIIESSRDQIPEWLMMHIPDDADALREMMIAWLRAHALEAKVLGEQAGRAAAHVLIGMIIGAMAALHEKTIDMPYLPLAGALAERLARLNDAFRRIVFAQVRIAGINAVLTGIYLLIVLPLLGVNLPLAKTLVVITFLTGLLPVVGNLISNTILVIVGLSHSLNVAVGSLVFLMVIHKLEYFLNARIIGTQIQARSWELLVAILAMEAAFGLYGVIAAPVLYAYVKSELMKSQLV
jgi:predicted PurR-regulated permease PerM